MRKYIGMGVGGLCIVTMLRLGATQAFASSQQPVNAADPAFYKASVAPILQANCVRCHGGLNHRGGYSMDSRASLLKGGGTGPAIVPGHPEQSYLMKLVTQHALGGDDHPMPPKGKLSDADLLVLEQWIRAGAAVPTS